LVIRILSKLLSLGEGFQPFPDVPQASRVLAACLSLLLLQARRGRRLGTPPSHAGAAHQADEWKHRYQIADLREIDHVEHRYDQRGKQHEGKTRRSPGPALPSEETDKTR
jgi:hypothetical protein